MSFSNLNKNTRNRIPGKLILILGLLLLGLALVYPAISGMLTENIASIQISRLALNTAQKANADVLKNDYSSKDLSVLSEEIGLDKFAHWLIGWSRTFWRDNNPSYTIVLDYFQSRNLEPFLSSTEKDWVASVRCSQVLSGLPNADTIINYLDLALKASPGYPDALALKGIALGQLNRKTEGLSLLETAINTAPSADRNLMQTRLLQFYMTVQDYVQADQIASEILNNFPNDADVNTIKAQILILSKNCSDAIQYAQSAVQTDPERAANWKAFGDANWCADKKTEAVAAYRKAIQLSPGLASQLNNRLLNQP